MVSMARWVGKVAVVTGASAGIGASICEKLVEEGLHVVGIARRKNLMDEICQKLSDKKGKLYSFQADLSNEKEILAAFEWIRKNLGPVHILVNNAGLILPTNLTNGDTEMWRTILEVNVLGLCIATREAIQDMNKNEIDGHIVHINSIAGHKVPDIPLFNIYPASKFAVTALTESLRVELNSLQSKIKITSISPGAVATEFINASGIQPDEQVSKAFKVSLNPEDVANAVLYVLSTPPHVQVQELTIKPVNEPF
ncbi:unnamed protein product [Phaedon cochleariae]|uniref:Farnesol dehydrogenase-like n=1 Tax=Phaedon cochleariae TaxID=80249 RepID=A0A9P0DIF0_PHACE|nr:unnamed protein product [Phaedon cochleariae]